MKPNALDYLLWLATFCLLVYLANYWLVSCARHHAPMSQPSVAVTIHAPALSKP